MKCAPLWTIAGGVANTLITAHSQLNSLEANTSGLFKTLKTQSSLQMGGGHVSLTKARATLTGSLSHFIHYIKIFVKNTQELGQKGFPTLNFF
jgi:hypothetical protein